MPKVKPSTSQKDVVSATSTESEAGYDSASSSSSSSRKTTKSRAKSRAIDKKQPRSKLKQKVKQVEPKCHSVDQWVKKLRECEDLNLGFVQILGEIQKNIIDRLDVLEENLYSHLQQKTPCSTVATIADGDSKRLYFSEEIQRYKQILDVELPIAELKTFMDFDESLGDDKEKLDAFRNLIMCITAGSNHIDYDVNTIMHSTITQNVRLNYSGAGRTYNGIRKRSFSITNVYQCMEDALIDKYKKTTIELRIKTKVSRWFSTRNFYY